MISIITPFKNRSDLFLETIESIINQNCTDWEYIIVNDASNVEELKIVEEKIAKHKQIRLITNPSKGANSARNFGAKHAQHDFIIFLDSDDLLGVDFVKNRINNINEDLDFIVFPVQVFREQPGDSDLLWNIKTEESDLLRFIKVDSPWHTTSTMWKKSFFMSINGFDESCKCWQDWEIHIKALTTKPIYIWCTLNEIDIFYRKNNQESISSNDSKAQGLKNRLDTYNIVLSKVDKIIINQYGYFFAKGLINVYSQLYKIGIVDKQSINLIKEYKLIGRFLLFVWKLRVKSKTKFINLLLDKYLYYFYGDHFLDTKTNFLNRVQ